MEPLQRIYASILLHGGYFLKFQVSSKYQKVNELFKAYTPEQKSHSDAFELGTNL